MNPQEIKQLKEVKMRRVKRSIKRAYAPNLGWQYPNGIFYRRACEMMGIDPDNNPNYKRS